MPYKLAGINYPKDCRGRPRLHVAGQRVVGVLKSLGATVDEHGLRFYGFLSETMECGVRAAASYISCRYQSLKSTRTVVSNAVGVCAMSMMRQLVIILKQK